MKDNAYKLLLGRFSLDTRGKFFTITTISSVLELSPEKWCIPQHQALQGSSGQGAGLPCLVCFCQKRLDQFILEISSNLLFYDSKECFLIKYVKSHGSKNDIFTVIGRITYSFHIGFQRMMWGLYTLKFPHSVGCFCMKSCRTLLLCLEI